MKRKKTTDALYREILLRFIRALARLRVLMGELIKPPEPDDILRSTIKQQIPFYQYHGSGRLPHSGWALKASPVLFGMRRVAFS